MFHNRVIKDLADFNNPPPVPVKTGEILCEIYTNNEIKIEKSVEKVKEMIKISGKKVKKLPHIDMSFMRSNN